MESRHGVIKQQKGGRKRSGGVRGRGGRGEGDKEGGGVVVENCMCMCMCVSISFILLMIKCERTHLHPFYQQLLRKLHSFSALLSMSSVTEA